MAKIIVQYPYMLKADAKKALIERLQKDWENGLLIVDNAATVSVLKDEDVIVVQTNDEKPSLDNILEKYDIDEITGNLGTLLDDNDCRYYGEHDNEWFWLWKFVEDIYNAAAKENERGRNENS